MINSARCEETTRGHAEDGVSSFDIKRRCKWQGERFWEFWAVMNALYSDYYAVAKKYNMLNPDFFADMAMAFLSDKDAVRNKAAVYYECIVER